MNDLNQIGLTCVQPSGTLIDINKLVTERFKGLPNKAELDKQFSPCEIVMEHIGRVCYNSYDAMTDTSITKFLSSAANKGHRSIFEFGQLQFMMITDKATSKMVYDLLIPNKYININVKKTETHEEDFGTLYIINLKGSPRAFMEVLEMFLSDSMNVIPVSFYKSLYFNLKSLMPSMVTNWETYDALNTLNILMTGDINNDESSLADITGIYSSRSHFTKFLTYVVCGRDVTHEIVRHRPVSYMQESQRYIRFDSKNPYMICLGTEQYKSMGTEVEEYALDAFKRYSKFLQNNKPENARVVLPNCAKTSIFIYADMEEYRHFFRMRQSKFAYPPIKEVFDQIYQQLIDRKYI